MAISLELVMAELAHVQSGGPGSGGRIREKQGGESRWNTLRALRILRAVDAIDPRDDPPF